MSKVLQLRRGTTAQNDSFTGAVGEVTVDTTKKTLRLHDGSTAGGKEIIGKSDLATVATSGSYADLSNKPSLATVATSGSYSDLSNKPSLATVATSGSYADLSNKPTIPSAVTVDSALSTTSTNPVQNKVVAAAISTAGAEVGDLRLYAGSSVPDGWFRCDGSTVSNMATLYPKLYAILGTNVLPNYRCVLAKVFSSSVSLSSVTVAANGTLVLNGLGTVSVDRTVGDGTGGTTTTKQTVYYPSGTLSYKSGLKVDASSGASVSIDTTSNAIYLYIKHD